MRRCMSVKTCLIIHIICLLFTNLTHQSPPPRNFVEDSRDVESPKETTEINNENKDEFVRKLNYLYSGTYLWWDKMQSLLSSTSTTTKNGDTDVSMISNEENDTEELQPVVKDSSIGLKKKNEKFRDAEDSPFLESLPKAAPLVHRNHKSTAQSPRVPEHFKDLRSSEMHGHPQDHEMNIEGNGMRRDMDATRHRKAAEQADNLEGGEGFDHRFHGSSSPSETPADEQQMTYQGPNFQETYQNAPHEETLVAEKGHNIDEAYFDRRDDFHQAPPLPTEHDAHLQYMMKAAGMDPMMMHTQHPPYHISSHLAAQPPMQPIFQGQGRQMMWPYPPPQNYQLRQAVLRKKQETSSDIPNRVT